MPQIHCGILPRFHCWDAVETSLGSLVQKVADESVSAAHQGISGPSTSVQRNY
ncbi:hypothetical protein [Desulfitobacterium hafniense]|uniref:hypothetical protein n=1 Tax=Desulfitobacterium hafniense TaxID=49338 RepID=UPI0013794BBE|nr:hypothetical protein [Desulfitobacterium hafniense]